MKPTLIDDLRQLLFYPEFRIRCPLRFMNSADGPDKDRHGLCQTTSAHGSAVSGPFNSDSSEINAVLSEIAIGLWDIERKLRPQEGGQTDRKQRLVYRRATKGIEALARVRVTIEDPTGKRYMQGSEGFMKPIEIQPTPGITREMVTETVVPIVYRNERVIRRGEVFVAVPLENAPTGTPSPSASVEASPPAGPADPSEPENDAAQRIAETLDPPVNDDKKTI